MCVVANKGLEDDLPASHFPVFRVSYLHRKWNRFAPSEKTAGRRGEDMDLRPRIADGDLDIVRALIAVLVGDRQQHIIISVDDIGEIDVFGSTVDLAIAVEIPGEFQHRARIRVERIHGTKLHGQRRQTIRRRCPTARYWCTGAPHIIEPDQLRVLVVAPKTAAPLQHVERAIGTQFQIDRAFEGDTG